MEPRDGERDAYAYAYAYAYDVIPGRSSNAYRSS
jgi:hypothetical protein